MYSMTPPPEGSVKIPQGIAEAWWDEDLASLYDHSGRRTGKKANPFQRIPERGGEFRFTREELHVVRAQCESDRVATGDHELRRQYRITATLCSRALDELDRFEQDLTDLMW